MSTIVGDPAAPADVPAPAEVMARAGGENFPVAARLLGRREREALLAIYGFARLADELGDSYPGDRLQALDWLEQELDRAFDGRAAHPLLVALTPVISACSLQRGPFVRLIEANRADQRVAAYDTWEELRAYCSLSADPVGELVLEVFGMATAERIAMSDSICTALQLAEHCQDLAEDRRAGRVYLPREDLERFGARAEELDAGRAAGPLRAAVEFEVDRARGLLDAGAPLLRAVHGRGRLAVVGFLAGGYAALGAIERVRYEVLAGPPQASRALLARHALTAVAAAARGGRGALT